MIDLRSDTVTRPTDEMRLAMSRADVGDDVYGEDPTVAELEEEVAGLLGQEAALYCVTGSLANALAVRAVVPVGTELLCEAQAHVVRAELGAHAALAGVTTRTWSHPRGLADVDLVAPMVAPDVGPYFVRTAAVSVENTHNFAGGTVQTPEQMASVRALCDAEGLAMHVDGARLWNAAAATGAHPQVLTGGADVVAVCLSKGLGAPVGSLVAGSRETVDAARVWRKRLGAGWRQAGMLAAGGLWALRHHRERLVDDHAHARLLAEACGVDPATVETNIVVAPVPDAAAVVGRLASRGVRAGATGPSTLRLVTHLDVSEQDARDAARIVAEELA
ncbi:threonine aldolase family protein [Solicola sp. PLA-1-18]|uniref:threonine aldolase family protein n=1 Tax=Solicola sp. PLA-1-18 TaxID=3380532 RepID=UPI003B7C020C